MANWVWDGIFAGLFNNTQIGERKLRQRFPDPEALKEARTEIRKCEDRLKAAAKVLADKLNRNQDRPAKDHVPPDMSVQKRWQEARREAERSYRSEADRAIADRDKGLKRIEDEQRKNNNNKGGAENGKRRPGKKPPGNEDFPPIMQPSREKKPPPNKPVDAVGKTHVPGKDKAEAEQKDAQASKDEARDAAVIAGTGEDAAAEAEIQPVEAVNEAAQDKAPDTPEAAPMRSYADIEDELDPAAWREIERQLTEAAHALRTAGGRKHVID